MKSHILLHATTVRNLNNFRSQFKNDPKAVLHYLRDHCPAVYDPFCGGGSIPLEAQRLGLRARASDLNPLPVLLNKAMIELPPKFHNQNPVNPNADPLGMFTGTSRRRTRVPWKGTAGFGRRYSLLWCLDAKRGTQTHRSSLSQSTIVRWYFCHCCGVALGAHNSVYQSCVWSPDALDENIPIVKEER